MSREYLPSSGHNEVLRDQVDSLLEVFEQQRSDLAEAQGKLAEITGEAWSSDNLVRVTANATGVPVRVHLVPEAFKRSTPEKLARSMAEAAQAAARAANARSQQAFASVTAVAGEIPDLPDLVPGAPSIKELLATPSLDPVGESPVPPPSHSPPPTYPPPSFPPAQSPGFPPGSSPAAPGWPSKPSSGSGSRSDVWVPTDVEDEEDSYYRNRRYLGGS
ncbi:YbaB/EbfC family nucleoid-associated protein [Nocardia macrotermitis]|uniref:Nucleoid-associated protein YbaB n=1 Tax=Nocardia macrotermitis TaxID=2585198 RepID=A0A7K0DER1_9NOCA|nr:YbaB/EbfC family nucleoid-associated protein [Nocardia macrotermitis]MQY24283.1 Nucleoid-associated protein YbaB [Nocardia macrotermitis]